jgi:ankyrin repeat protein
MSLDTEDTGKKQSIISRLLDEHKYTAHLSKKILVDLTHFLIEKGASVNQNVVEGSDSPLIQAVRRASYDLVNSIITHGANVNHPGKNRSTALHECVRGKKFIFLFYNTCKKENIAVISFVDPIKDL